MTPDMAAGAALVAAGVAGLVAGFVATWVTLRRKELPQEGNQASPRRGVAHRGRINPAATRAGLPSLVPPPTEESPHRSGEREMRPAAPGEAPTPPPDAVHPGGRHLAATTGHAGPRIEWPGQSTGKPAHPLSVADGIDDLARVARAAGVWVEDQDGAR